MTDPTTAGAGRAHGVTLDDLLGPEPPAFALLHRPTSTTGPDHLDLLVGDVTTVDRLADLPLPPAAGAGHELLALVPYTQIRERGFAHRDDGERIIALSVRDQAQVSVDEARRRIPDLPVEVTGTGFDVDDETYAATVRAVLDDEIGRGEGSNFVVKRSFVATLPGWSPTLALAIFRRLLGGETGAYWTFVVHTGSRTFLGATPERHVSLAGGLATMNPISGTYRYPAAGPDLDELLAFLGDRKEVEELYMVVDEELKMMGRVCAAGGRVVGPYLKEMGRLAHTEYFIEGRTTLDVRDILRETMFAPTVTGSPIENAFRVVARHETTGRGFYSGVAALVGRDAAGQRALDSAILIRTADVDAAGRLKVGVGATLVRLSDPDSEVAETRAKTAGVLAALGIAGTGATDRTPATAPDRPRLSDHVAVRAALAGRNATLARFWLEPEHERAYVVPELAGRNVLVVDCEDTFTSMLEKQLRALGLDVALRPWQDGFADLHEWDLVVVGPGPGDPRDLTDRKIATMRDVTRRLISARGPFFSVCLGHQVLSSVLGFDLVRRERPNQGLQKEIDLFGRRERVGFYNTFFAHSDYDRVWSPVARTSVAVSRDRQTGEVHALRGDRFASVQFHPESLLTEHGPAILTDLLAPLAERMAPTAVRRAS